MPVLFSSIEVHFYCSSIKVHFYSFILQKFNNRNEKADFLYLHTYVMFI